MAYLFERTFEGAEAERLDRVLRQLCSDDERLAGLSRSHLQPYIESGSVTVNGLVVTKPGFRVEPGSTLRLNYEAREMEHLQPLDMPLAIVFEDASMLVIDKPAGLTVHPGAGNRTETVVNALLARGVVSGEFPDMERPGIVHRLDKDTSGLLVIAKNPVSHERLSRQFSTHTAFRRYVALVYASPKRRTAFDVEESGVIDAPIGRDPHHRKRMKIVEGGRRAITHWRVRERMSYGTVIEFRLETGRTHQIRVHTASVGAPVVGDVTYGRIPDGLPRPLAIAAQELNRQALHAEALTLSHPLRGEEMEFRSKLPPDISRVIQIFREG